MSAAIIQMAGTSRAIHMTWQALRQASSTGESRRGQSPEHATITAASVVEPGPTPRRAL